MKPIPKKLLFAIFVLFFAVLNFSPAHAAIVPCGTATSPCTLCHMLTGFKNLIDWVKNLVFTAAILGVTVGGVLYAVSSGSSKMMETAKNFITASLVGFALTLCGWLIVNTVMLTISAQPNLGVGATNWYTFKCNDSSSGLSVNTAGNNPAGSSTNPNAPLSAAQIQSNCSGWCASGGYGGDVTTDQCNSKCVADTTAAQTAQQAATNNTGTGQNLSQSDAQQKLDGCGVKYGSANTLDGIQDVATNEMCGFKSASGCDTQITSGTTGSHATGSGCTHENGCKFDFSPTSCNDSYIKNNYPNTGTRSDGAACYSAPDGACYAREGSHWDMSTTRSCKAQGC